MITEYDNFINKEDLEASIQELKEEYEADGVNLVEYPDDLIELIVLCEEAEQYCSDWEHGENLINDNHFETLAKEMAVVPDRWPFHCIDWAQAADELKQDYTLIEFRGHDFYCL